MPASSTPPAVLAIGERFSALPEVVAIAWAGSATAGWGDALSDLDFNVYLTSEIPLAARASIAHDLGRNAELDNRFWEPGDEWIDLLSDAHCDVMYRSPAWIEDQLDRVLIRHQASVGYSTCFWYNVLTARSLYDPTGWFAGLQTRSAQPYPEALRGAVVAKNWPILRHNLSSYAHQIELAFARRDRVSINHRLAALVSSYFDILFAVNRQPHPGEKRLLQFAKKMCRLLPAHFERCFAEMFESAAGWDRPAFAGALHRLLDELDELLRSEGLLSAGP